MSKDSPRQRSSLDQMFSEAIENTKPFHEREIADVVTCIAINQPNLMKFQIFPNCFGPALTAMKFMAAASGLKKPFLTSWEKYMVLATLKEPTIFVVLAPYIALSGSGKQEQGFWDGKGRVIDTKALEFIRDWRELTKGLSGGFQQPPSSYFIEILIGPYFDRLEHLLEGA